VPELRPASRLLDVEIWGDRERLWIGLAATAGPPGGAGDEEAVPRNVERIDEGAGGKSSSLDAIAPGWVIALCSA
jgi:hypothetical protein